MRGLNEERGLTFLHRHARPLGRRAGRPDRAHARRPGRPGTGGRRRPRRARLRCRALRHPGRHARSSSSASRSPSRSGSSPSSRSASPCSSSSASATSARRRGRTALIVVGLMLGTTIIATALTTGDTMSHTIRSTAVRTLGQTDELVSARGHRGRASAPGSARPRASSTSTRRVVAEIDARARRDRPGRRRHPGRSIEPVAVQAPDAAPDRAARDALRRRPGAHGRLRRDRGRRAARSRSPTSGRSEVYLNEDAADELGVRARRPRARLRGRRRRCA